MRSQSRFLGLIAVLALLGGTVALPVSAAEPHAFDPGFLWFVSGHGVNLGHIADGGETLFATTRFVPGDAAPLARERMQIAGIRSALARFRTQGEHVVPAGLGPGSGADAMAARIIRMLDRDVQENEIELVVGFDVRSGRQRTILRSARDGTLFDPDTIEPGDAASLVSFLPLYSVEERRLRIHFKSDTQRYPSLDRSMLAAFGTNRRGPRDRWIALDRVSLPTKSFLPAP